MLEPGRNEEWFVSEGGNLIGPHPATRIRDLIRWGRVSEGAYLCDTEGSAWIPIARSALAPFFEETDASHRVSGVRVRARPGRFALSPEAQRRLLALVAAMAAFGAVVSGAIGV